MPRSKRGPKSSRGSANISDREPEGALVATEGPEVPRQARGAAIQNEAPMLM
jgi:hypothetical protein